MVSRLIAWCSISVITAYLILGAQQLSPLPATAQQSSPPAAAEEKGTTEKNAKAADDAKKEEPDDYELMQTFVEAFRQIDSNYVKKLSRKQLVEAAIRGMTSELDPYSSYIDEDEKAAFEQDVTQEFGGIGIQVDFDPVSKTIQVVSPLPGTPAYKAGIKAGDKIVEIEGQKVRDFKLGKETDTAVKLMKGPSGGIVKLAIQREGVKDDMKFDVERAVIKVATVMGDTYGQNGKWNFMLEEKNKVGYIRITHFTGNTTDELKRAMGDLVEAGMKGLIIDLRFNPGGLLTSATEICDMYIQSGKIVSTKGRNTPERTWEARKRGTYGDFPIAILINRYSASASEIVSACLQDHKRAVIIGERSWGKGSVQNVIDVNGGASSLKLTTASYHRPSGKNIHRFPGATDKDEWGVMPDEGYKVEFNNRQMGDYLKYRQKRDILNEKNPDENSGKFEDIQLAKAKEFIYGKLGVKIEEKPADPAKSEKEDKKPEVKTDEKKEVKEEK